MRKGFIGALGVALTGSGLALAQPAPLVKMALTGQPTTPTVQRVSEPPFLATADAPPEKIDAPKDAKGTAKAPLLPAPTTPPLTSPGYLEHSSCSPGCCQTCEPCCEKEPRFWITGENLLWWVKHGPLPVPLVGTGTAASLGIPGNPGASTLFGNTGLNYGELEGFRVGAGAWLNDCRTIGVEGSFFMLEQGVTRFSAAGDPTGNPVITLPIINAQTGTPAGLAVSLPGAFAGAVSVKSTSRFFGSDLNGVYNVVRNDGLSVDALAGVRYLNLQETLSVRRSASVLPGGNRFFLGANIPGPSVASVADEFDTQDQFFGGQFGAQVSYKRNKLSASLSAKVALGGNYDITNTHGTSSLAVPGAAPVVVAGGLLAGPSNSGRTHSTAFSWSPELGAHIGYQITDRIRITGGYTWLYWDELARPGNQIDRVVNLTQFPFSPTFGPLNGPPRPAPTLHRSEFWAQGIDVGLGISF